MSNPTTPFSWQMPTNTDLVTDLPADFEVFGQAVATSMADLLGGTTGQILSKTTNADMDFTWIANDQGDITGVTAGTGISGGGTSGTVTVTNSMATAIDAKGDLIAGTGADAFSRLAIGTNNQVLTADSAETTGMKWATSSPGALTLITTTTFSNVASQAFDSIFTSTYKTYFVAINQITSANALDDLQLQFRYAGPTTQTSGYYGSAFVVDPNAATAGTASYNAAQVTLCTATGGTDQGAGIIYFNRVGDSSTNPVFHGRFLDASGSQSSFGGKVDSARVYTGFLLKSSSSNITGSVSIYGLAL